MLFNDHSTLNGAHAFLSASKYHWINYTPEKLATTYLNFRAAQHGTEMHEFAKRAIELGVKLPRTKKTINMYVNDGIGFRMKPEQVLFYSYNCFGTADTISFKDNLLRIHDLKTGSNRVSMTQLKIYAAIFCLEYKVKPGAIESELRIYQNDAVLVEQPDMDEITRIIDKIVSFDKLIEKMRAKGQ